MILITKIRDRYEGIYTTKPNEDVYVLDYDDHKFMPLGTYMIRTKHVSELPEQIMDSLRAESGDLELIRT